MPFPNIAEFVFLNGKILHKSRARISPLDDGFLFADAIYEVWCARDGAVELFAENFAELRRGLKFSKIKFDLSAGELKKIFALLLAKNKLRDARIRLTATRQNIFIETSPLVQYSPKITAFTVLLERKNPLTKSTDWLATVAELRKKELRLDHEALLLNRQNEITEGAQSNFFLVKNSKIFTPPAELVHPGAVRGWVLRAAKKLKIPVRERKIKLREIFSADEIFVTGSLSGIRAISQIDNRKIASGKIGSLTKILQKEFARTN